MLCEAEWQDISPRKRLQELTWSEIVGTVFYLVFFLAYVVSGHMIMLNVTPFYRLGIIATLCIAPLWLIRGRLRIDAMFFAYIGCTIVTFMSAFYNGIGIKNALVFIRAFIYSYFAYYLVRLYVRPYNIVKLVKICIALAVIQMPIVIMQQLFLYNYLPWGLSKNVSQLDYDFGTFVGDAGLSFFLNLLVIFLLFDKEHAYFVSRRWKIILWLTATVWIAHSELGKLVSAIIWGTYFITNLKRPKIFLRAAVGMVLLFGIASAFGIYADIKSGFQQKLRRDAAITGKKELQERYLSGGHAKGAAVYYYLHSDILWLGDGPSVYSNAIDKSKVRGNFGHNLIFYSEIGLFGWLLSIFIFLFIAFDGVPKKRSDIRWVNFMIFVTMCLMGFSSTVMSDISYIIMAGIMSKSYLIPVRNPKVPETDKSLCQK